MTIPSKKENTKDVNAPVVIDLGKRKRKMVKRLKKGKPGRLMNEIQDCLEELQSSDVISDSAQPVIIVVREKKKRKRWTW